MSVERHVFATKDKLAEALAEAVAENLNTGIDQHGTAVLAVSGGSTPKRFFEALSNREDIDWESVVVTLVDERWVDETSDRSNAKLVKENLLKGPAAAAAFVPLFSGGEEPDDAGIARTNAALADLPGGFDAVILGMGNDGHTASFFPGGDTLSDALTGEGPAIAIRAPGAGEARVTFTLPRLLATRALYLHIEGDEKAQVFDKALETGPVEDMPVRAVLSQSAVPVSLFWCP
ncbi:6-phosphogluconolactonase [Pelagibacterium xiamenense]|uniref:6-phosphogluconolactonase n=1 Tax=Pelagibacterium xiamenense TaxID=2901140 RepID=UPI001E5CEC0C|nr:6-phosphogluconolactonase [Pelagibacterium xiamenense]MCD7058837.1 6-phosphogluconolactonase [Pelagibacterium xiamenense]